MKDEIPPYKQEIAGQLEIRVPGSILNGMPRAGTTELTHGGEVVAKIQKPGVFSTAQPSLRVANRRFRFDRPDDVTLGEGFRNFLRSFFGMPRRRAIWRAGAGVLTEIRETSQSHDQLTGAFELDEQPYHVSCAIKEGAFRGQFDGRLHGPGGVHAIVEASAFEKSSFMFTLQRPTRLDALVIGFHLMLWLGEGTGGGVGGGDGGGGGC